MMGEAAAASAHLLFSGIGCWKSFPDVLLPEICAVGKRVRVIRFLTVDRLTLIQPLPQAVDLREGYAFSIGDLIMLRVD